MTKKIIQPQGLPDGIVLLDGGMGRELRYRGVELSPTIWSATGLIDAPDIVRRIHEDYILAGADIITTNTYGLIREDLAKEGLENRFDKLNVKAGLLAQKACKISDHSTLVAGSLPPLKGSFRPDLNTVKGFAEKSRPVRLALKARIFIAQSNALG